MNKFLLPGRRRISTALSISAAYLATAALCGCQQSGHANMSSEDAKAFATRPDPNHIPPEIQAAMAEKRKQDALKDSAPKSIAPVTGAAGAPK